MKKIHISEMEVGKEYILLLEKARRLHKPFKAVLCESENGYRFFMGSCNHVPYSPREFYYDYKYEFYKNDTDVVLWTLDDMEEIKEKVDYLL